MRKLNTKSKFLALTGLISVATLVLEPARLASAQVAAPSWTYTGNLNTARFDDTATLLPNGKVLVAGGNSGSPIGDLTAELYDSAAGTWSSTGSATGRSGKYGAPLGGFLNTATLLPRGRS